MSDKSRHYRGDARFSDSLSNVEQAGSIGIIVFVDGEIKVVGAIDLDVYETGAMERMSSRVDKSNRKSLT